MSSPSTRTWRWSFLRSSHSFCMWLCHPPIKSKVYPLPPPHTHTHTHISKFCCIGLCFLWLRECDGSDVLRLVSLGSKKARLIVTLKLYKVWGNLGERYTELLVLFLQIFYKVRNFFKIRGVKWKDFFFFFLKEGLFALWCRRSPDLLRLSHCGAPVSLTERPCGGSWRGKGHQMHLGFFVCFLFAFERTVSCYNEAEE